MNSKRKRLLGLPPLNELTSLGTEKPNPRSAGLDRKSALEIARLISAEDRKVARAIEPALPKIAEVIDLVAKSLASGGRLIYVGTGTSGRLGALDASECTPTFNADPKMVQFVIAGGDRALGRAVESEEDSPAAGERDIARKKPSRNDVVFGLAASGRTPYTIAALDYARRKGSWTVALSANPGSPISRVADHSIEIDVGPEVVTGSTRMKAGTMQKLVLNMITTGAFTRMGYVYGNLMVNLHLKNRKLVERAIGIVRELTGLDRNSTVELLRASGGSVPVALVMFEGEVSRLEAEGFLEKAKGNVRRAIALSRR